MKTIKDGWRFTMKEHCNCPDCCCGDKDCSGKEFLEEEVAEQ
jgi:hypothetical protein